MGLFKDDIATNSIEYKQELREIENSNYRISHFIFNEWTLIHKGFNTKREAQNYLNNTCVINLHNYKIVNNK